MSHLCRSAHAIVLALVLTLCQVHAVPLLATPNGVEGRLEVRTTRTRHGPTLTKTGKIVFGTVFGVMAAIFVGIFVYANCSRMYRDRRAKKEQEQMGTDRPIESSTDTTPQSDLVKPLPEVPPQYEDIPMVDRPGAVANTGREPWKEGTTAVASMPEPSAHQPAFAS